MILKPLKARRTVRKVTAYDMEWIPGSLDIRLVGAYDERGYRHYTSVDSFLDSELNYRNSRRWYYAHSGGLHDVQFVLESAIKRRIPFEATFANSSAIIVRLGEGREKQTFIDSFHLFNQGLAKIAKWIGVEKGQQDLTEEELIEWFRSAPLSELIEYNEQDCKILYQAITNYQSAIWDLGGQLRMTQASCAMDLFRRCYLSREIEVSDEINSYAREAYFASRVEVFAPRCEGANYYDINSSFPAAMREPLPASSTGLSDRPKGEMYLADAEIEIRECYLPPTPTRIGGRLFFPTGSWRAWLSSIDLELLEREGHRITAIHRAINFEPFTDLKHYATDLYNRRQRETNPFGRAVFKLALNSVYGKFGESSDKIKALFDPPNIRELRLREKRGEAAMLLPGLWLTSEHRDIIHAHVPIATWITAAARRAIYDPMSRSDELYYCDTDGFATNSEHPVSDGLGGLKLEKTNVNARFLAPKLYAMDALGPDGEPLEIYAGKGFSKLDRERFDALESGEAITVRRMSRLRGLWRSGSTRPEEIEVAKRLSDSTRPKRAPDGDNTRPWSIDELIGDSR